MYYRLIKWSSTLFLFFLTSLLPHESFAQTSQSIPLKIALDQLSDRLNLSFSYRDLDIEDILVLPLKQGSTLNESLTHLSTQTGLVFQVIDDDYIAIVKTKDNKKAYCGFIRNAETEDPLIGAIVFTGTTSSITDQKGYFIVEPDYSDTNSSIVIRHLGYEPLLVSQNEFSNECLELKMSPTIAYLPEVIISEFLTEGISKHEDGALLVSTENLEVLPGTTDPDIFFSLQAIPGISSTNETVSNLNIRGGTHDQNLILWEGIKLYQSGHFFGLISAINPYFGNNVKVIKNGTSALLGDGVSGTLQIESTIQPSDQVSGSLGLGLNMINCDINLTVPISEKTDLKFSSRRAITDLVRTPTFDSYFDRAFQDTELTNVLSSDSIEKTDNFYFFDINAMLQHRFTPTEKISVSILAIENNLELDEISLINSNTRQSSLQQNSLAFGTTYSKTWNNSFQTDLEAYSSSYELKAVNFDIPNDQRLFQRNTVTDYNLKAIAMLNSEAGNLKAGFQINEIGIENEEDLDNPDFFRLQKEVLHTYSVFVEDEMAYSNLNFRFGIRSNFYNEFDIIRFEPRINILYQASDKVFLELLGETKSQASLQVIDLQTDFLGVEKRRWVLSNKENLPLLTSQNLSAGVSFEKPKLLVNFESYVRNIEGVVTSSQGFRNQYELIRSTGKLSVVGAELLVQATFNPIETWIATSVSKGEYEFKELQAERFPSNQDIRIRSVLGMRYKKGPFSVSSGLILMSGVPFTELTNNGLPFQFDTPNGDRLENYLRLDLSARYTFSFSERTQAQLALSCWNVSNSKNLLNKYYLESENQINEIDQRALQRTPNIMMRVFF